MGFFEQEKPPEERHDEEDFTIRDPNTNENVPHPTLSSFISLSKEQLEWIYDVRLLGKNADTGYAYLSGPGTVGEYGWADVARGEDLDAPEGYGDEKDRLSLPT